jgi:hypothetical protein
MVRRRLAVAAVLCAGFLMAAVSTAAESQVVEPSASDALDVYDPLFDDDELESIDERSDPFETGNRWVFDFNEGLDCRVFDPITRTYQFLVPQFARVSSIRRMSGSACLLTSPTSGRRSPAMAFRADPIWSCRCSDRVRRGMRSATSSIRR